MPDLFIVLLFFAMLLFPCIVAVRSASQDGEEKVVLVRKTAIPVRR